MKDASTRLAENARITLEIACRLKRGESLVLCTRRTKHRYVPGETVLRYMDALKTAGEKLGAQVTVLDLTDFLASPDFAQGKTLDSVRTAFESADVVVTTNDDVGFSRLIGRKDNDDEFLTSERRWVFLQCNGMDEWNLKAKDVAAIRPRTERLREMLLAAREVRLTSPAGTDFRFEMGAGAQATLILGIVPLYGEVATAPRQGSESGVLVVDGPTQQGVRKADELARTPLRIEVENGRAVRWSGDPEQVKRLESFLAVGEPTPHYIDEVGIPTSRVMENDRYWWSDGTHHLERIHVALGNNVRRQSHVHGARHMDCEINRPSLAIDGQWVIQDARFLGPLAD